MLEFDFQNLELELFTIDELQLYKLPIPHPPQLTEALGYFGMNEKIGVWRDNFKTTVSDGYKTFTASNPGWDSYCNHPQINPYLRYLHHNKVDIYGEENKLGVAKYGFAIGEKQIYLADVKTITKLLQKNEDCRPDWVKNATEEKVLNPIWMAKYQEWSEAVAVSFPKYNQRCYRATREMLDWLENRN